MKKIAYMKEDDYSIFEINKSLIRFSDLFFYKKWKAKIRSELEKMYPNFDSFTIWDIKDLYNPIMKKIIVIVIEPEIYALYLQKNNFLKILYKGRKYYFRLKKLKFFFSFPILIFFLALLFNANAKHLNKDIEENLIHEILTIENSDLLSPLEKHRMTFDDFFFVLKNKYSNAKIQKMYWNKDETFKIEIDNIFPEAIYAIFNTNQNNEKKLESMHLEYFDNIPKLFLETEFIIDFQKTNKIHMLDFRNAILKARGKIIKEDINAFGIGFEISKDNLFLLNSSLNEKTFLVQMIEVTSVGQIGVFFIKLSNEGLDFKKILSLFEETKPSVPHKNTMPKFETKITNDGLFIGEIKDENGKLIKYFKNKENKIYSIVDTPRS